MSNIGPGIFVAGRASTEKKIPWEKIPIETYICVNQMTVKAFWYYCAETVTLVWEVAASRTAALTTNGNFPAAGSAGGKQRAREWDGGLQK